MKGSEVDLSSIYRVSAFNLKIVSFFIEEYNFHYPLCDDAGPRFQKKNEHGFSLAGTLGASPLNRTGRITIRHGPWKGFSASARKEPDEVHEEVSRSCAVTLLSGVVNSW